MPYSAKDRPERAYHMEDNNPIKYVDELVWMWTVGVLYKCELLACWYDGES